MYDYLIPAAIVAVFGAASYLLAYETGFRRGVKDRREGRTTRYEKGRSPLLFWRKRKPPSE